MPTVSQWKILHEMLKSGRLKQGNEVTDERDKKETNEEEGKEKNLSKETIKRRNSFQFFQNARGILTIVCRPKSVPVSFGLTKAEDNVNYNICPSSGEKISEETDENEKNPNLTSYSTGGRHEYDLTSKSFSSITLNQSNSNETNPEHVFVQQYSIDQETEETPRLWDGISDFPELLDPNAMRKARHTSVPIRVPSTSSVQRRSSIYTKLCPDTKINKSVTFSRPSSNTIQHQTYDDVDDVEDEDNLGITLDNVDTILPKFNNPYRKGGYSDQSMLAPSINPLRPLRSAPALRRITKSIAAFNTTHNLKRCNTSMSYTDATSVHQDRHDQMDSSNHGFKIRHTTFAYKELSWKKDKPICPWNPKATEKEDFEPYVIQNGRLVRKGSLSGMVGGNLAGNVGNVRRSNSKFAILGKDEATTLSAVCDAFTVRGSKHTDHDTGDQQCHSARALSRPSSTKEVSRWSMATQSIITRSVSVASTTTASASGILHSKDSVTDVEVQENLQKLGFRKQKGKKKRTEKTKKNTINKKTDPKEEAGKNVIDIKGDPVLQKIQKKNKNVGTFTCEPEAQPHAVCFEIKGSVPCHADVVEEMKKLVKTYPEVVIEKLQFDNRSLVNNSPDVDNRWIITTNSVACRNRLAGSYIRVCGQETQLRRYDDVITTEYQQYRRMMDFVKMMNQRLGLK